MSEGKGIISHQALHSSLVTVPGIAKSVHFSHGFKGQIVGFLQLEKKHSSDQEERDIEDTRAGMKN